MLYVIITVLGPLSDAHFNPAVTLADRRGDIAASLAVGFGVAQVVGGGVKFWPHSDCYS